MWNQLGFRRRSCELAERRIPGPHANERARSAEDFGEDGSRFVAPVCDVHELLHTLAPPGGWDQAAGRPSVDAGASLPCYIVVMLSRLARRQRDESGKHHYLTVRDFAAAAKKRRGTRAESAADICATLAGGLAVSDRRGKLFAPPPAAPFTVKSPPA